MSNNVLYVPDLRPGEYMVLEKGTEAYSYHRGTYVLKRAQVVKLAHYHQGFEITASTALNDRDYYDRLAERGFDFAPLIELRETNPHKFHNDLSIMFNTPKVVWAGSGGYWCSADIIHPTKA